MEVVFWVSVVFVPTSTRGTRCCWALWARYGPADAGTLRSAAGRRGPAAAGTTRNCPGVSSHHCRAQRGRRLPARIDNILASRLPADRLQIIVASDGSTDDTAEALAPYRRAHHAVDVAAHRQGRRAQRRRRREASHPMLVFADARQRFAPDAIRRLVSHFARSRRSVPSPVSWCSTDTARSTIGDGVGAYWNYEKWLRRREAIVGSTLGVTGAIYAMRRSLWRPLPADTILDDVHGADARGAARLPGDVRRRRPAHSTRPRRTRRPSCAASRARWPATSSCSRTSRGCWSRSSTRCGCSSCRTRSAGCSCPTRSSRPVVPAPGWRRLRCCTRSRSPRSSVSTAWRSTARVLDRRASGIAGMTARGDP